MNFSLVRLLTSLRRLHLACHLSTPVVGVCFPQKETAEKFLCLVSRIGISTTLSRPIDWDKGTIYSIFRKWSNVSSCTESTDSTRKLFFQLWTAEPPYFQAKLYFTTSFTFKKGKLKVKFTLFGKYFQSKIRFQDKNIHKPIFPPPPPHSPIKKGADIRSQRSSPHPSIKKRGARHSSSLLIIFTVKRNCRVCRTSTVSNSSHYSSYGKNRNP